MSTDASLTIRAATVADAAAIARVHVGSWRSAYAGILPEEVLRALSVDTRTEAWRDILGREEPNELTLVATLEGVAGFANAGPSRDDDTGPETGELRAIYVDPRCFGAGAGRALLAKAERFLLDSGFRQAILWVIPDNARACRFYEAAGWERDGGERPECLEVTGGSFQTQVVRYRRTLG